MAEGQKEIMTGKINAMAGEDCKKFNDTYNVLIKLQHKAKKMHQMTNTHVPVETMMNVLYNAADDETVEYFDAKNLTAPGCELTLVDLQALLGKPTGCLQQGGATSSSERPSRPKLST